MAILSSSGFNYENHGLPNTDDSTAPARSARQGAGSQSALFFRLVSRRTFEVA
jgi:hypothetical protein